jgi:predicted XRE-type DNA-binding protein
MNKTPRPLQSIGSVVSRDAIAREIGRVITDRGLTQNQVSYVTGEPQSQISLVVTRKLRGFSVEHLFRILNGLGRDVEIRIAQSKRGRGKVRLNVTPS